MANSKYEFNTDTNADFKHKIDTLIKSPTNPNIDTNLENFKAIREKNEPEYDKAKTGDYKLKSNDTPELNVHTVTDDTLTNYDTHIKGDAIHNSDYTAYVNSQPKTNTKLAPGVQYHFSENIKGDPEFDISAAGNKDILQDKLYRCAELEHLYLYKHNELLKMFEFTVLIFDRYTYTTELLLYLIKHLKTTSPPTSPSPSPPPGPTPGSPGPSSSSQTILCSEVVNTLTEVPNPDNKIKFPSLIVTDIPRLIKQQKAMYDHIVELKNTINDDNILGDTSKSYNPPNPPIPPIPNIPSPIVPGTSGSPSSP